MASATQQSVPIPRITAESRAAFPSLADGFNVLDAEIEAWSRRFTKASAAHRWEEERLQANGVRTARRQVANLYAAVALHVIDLTDGLMLLIDATRRHAAYPVARAIIEAAGIAAYVQQEVAPRIAKGRVTQVDDTLRRLTLGMDRGLDHRSGIDPIPVSSLIDALKRVMDQQPTDGERSAHDTGPGTALRQFYSHISDHAHPNMSALHLSSDLTDGAASRWDRHRGWQVETLELLVGSTYLALWGGGVAFDDAMKTTQKTLVLAKL